MARDLCSEVERLLGDAHAYVRKKAALCGIRVIRKVPELHENFVQKVKAVLNERTHAVLLTGLTLINEICLVNEETIPQFRKMVPTLVRQLKGLTSASSAGEHDVGGISDPFLQVRILRLLRVLGRNDPEASEAMGDVLAQVATNTDGSKNVGNSILYECVLTIMDIESEPGLRVLAVNILGRFLANKDNNIRYVALNTLLKTVSKDINAVQRHRKTVVDCLRDHDISIRRRALELSFALINEGNVRVMIRELLAFLEKSDKEFKPVITTEICIAADSFAPNKRWHFDTIHRVLRLGGNFVKDDILYNFAALISSSPEIHGYSAHKLYASLREDVSQEYLVYAGLWTIGEFGDILINEALPADEDSPALKVTETEVLDLLESVLNSPFTSAPGREYAITALMKMTSRVPSSTERVQRVLKGLSDNISVELQQRAVEDLRLFDFASTKNALFERMPAAESRAIKRAGTGATEEVDDSAPAQVPAQSFAQPNAGAPSSSAPASRGNDLLDLDLMGDVTPSARGTGGGGSGLDMLSDLLGLSSVSSSAPSSAPSHSLGAGAGGLLGDLGLGGGFGGAPAAPAGPPTLEKNGVRVTFESQIDPTNPTILNVRALFTNQLPSQVNELNLQVAVPKTQKIQMQPPASTTIGPFNNTQQLFRISNPSRVRNNSTSLLWLFFENWFLISLLSFFSLGACPPEGAPGLLWKQRQGRRDG